MPKGKKWISGFRFCGGGYLASNHIGLLGLSRNAEVTVMRPEEPNNPVADWATAVKIRFQRGKDTVDNILACDRQGMIQLPFSGTACHSSRQIQQGYPAQADLGKIASSRRHP